MKSFQWNDARTVEQAAQQLGEGTVLKAGGVDLLDLMKEHLAAPRRVVNLRTVPGLDQLADDEKTGLRIGPMVTLARLSADPGVRKRYTVLADAAGNAATPQIRNMATVGGNLLQRPRCWYFRSEEHHCRKKGGDVCFAQNGENQYHAIFNNSVCAIVHPSAAATALVALGGSIELSGPGGRREVLLEQFFTLPTVDVRRENSIRPDEVLTEIRVPAPAANTKQAYWKQGEKESFDWPVAEVAVVLEMDGPRCRRASIVLGAAAPVPRRARDAEAALTGQAVTEDVARTAAKAAMADASPMTGNGYKVPLFETIIRRTILAAVQGGQA